MTGNLIGHATPAFQLRPPGSDRLAAFVSLHTLSELRVTFTLATLLVGLSIGTGFTQFSSIKKIFYEYSRIKRCETTIWISAGLLLFPEKVFATLFDDFFG